MHAHIDTGSACRHPMPASACPLCGSDAPAPGSEEQAGRSDPIASADAVLAAVKAVRERGATRLTLRGGDLATRPEALDLLAESRKLGFEAVEVWSAGPALARPGTAAQLVAAGASHLAVPLYGDTAPAHDYVSGVPGTFRYVLEGLRKSAAAGARTTLLLPLLRPTVRNLPLLVRHAQALEAAGLRLLAPPGPDRLAHPLLAPLLLAAPYVRATLQLANSARRRVAVQGMPPCLLAEFGPLALREPPLTWSALTGAAVTVPPGAFGKPCQTCTWKSRCPGVQSGLATRLSWSHLEPRTDPLP